MAAVSEPHLRGIQSSLERDAARKRLDSRSGPPQIASPKQPWTRLLAIPTLLALLGVAAMNFDMQIAMWARGRHYPSDLKKLLDLAEVFGHGLGVVFILFSAWVLAPDKRPSLPRVIAASIAAGVTGTLSKMFIARNRPNKVVYFSNGVLETFGDWFPLFSNTSGLQSFPSGHSAMAAGLAVGLTSLFPRGKWLFTALAAMVMLQRIFSGYHFVSDTLWGAAIGYFIASAVLYAGWLSRSFDRLEQRLTTA
jgi:membrane-associated phospholipid phosphatase